MEGGDKLKEIEPEKLDKITGGTAISIWTGIVIAAIVVFIAGVIEGLTKPLWQKCRNIELKRNLKGKHLIQIL